MKDFEVLLSALMKPKIALIITKIISIFIVNFVPLPGQQQTMFCNKLVRYKYFVKCALTLRSNCQIHAAIFEHATLEFTKKINNKKYSMLLVFLLLCFIKEWQTIKIFGLTLPITFKSIDPMIPYRSMYSFIKHDIF